jgi:hypothetical protein
MTAVDSDPEEALTKEEIEGDEAPPAKRPAVRNACTASPFSSNESYKASYSEIWFG